MGHSTKIDPPFEERVGGWDNFYDLFITQNKTQREIAEIFGVSREVVRSYAHKHGLYSKPKELLTENRQKTCVKKYGATSPLKSSEIKERTMKKNMEKYGVPWSLMNSEVNQKARKTMLDKYGVEYSGQSPELLKKLHDTLEERTGYRFATWAGKDHKNIEILASPEKFRKFIEEAEDKTLIGLAKALGYEVTSIQNKVREYGFEDLYDPYYFTSSEEKEVEDYLIGIGVSVRKNKKDIHPKEIDLYNDDTRSGVEFNGCFFHRVDAKGELYHQEKSIAALKRGIRIYHLYEYEWVDTSRRKFIENDLQDVFGLLSGFDEDIELFPIDKDGFEKFKTENGYDDVLFLETGFSAVSNGKTVVMFSTKHNLTDNEIFVGTIMVSAGISKSDVKKKVLRLLQRGNIPLVYRGNLDKENIDFLVDSRFVAENTVPPRVLFCSYYTHKHIYEDMASAEDIDKYSKNKAFYRVANAGEIEWRWTCAKSTKSV